MRADSGVVAVWTVTPGYLENALGQINAADGTVLALAPARQRAKPGTDGVLVIEVREYLLIYKTAGVRNRTDEERPE